jgi:ectoine hydroxylase-related dioxygenase (phytanoyl-CoA dioxygenase family)
MSDSGDLRRRYETDGYVIVRSVIDQPLLDDMSRHVEWLIARNPDRAAEDLGTELVAADPFWLTIVSDNRLLDLAETFVGPDLALFASAYIMKPPGAGRPILWHQDGIYWPLDPLEVVSLWLAVDPSTSANGCMRVLPGSHRQPLHELRMRDDVVNVFGSESAVDIDESAAVDLVLEPGDVEIHHPHLLHSSGPNRSRRRRCGLTIRYIPTSTRITTEEQPFVSAFQLRGDAGVNQYQEPPVFDPEEHFS